jgi:hypothetical protein
MEINEQVIIRMCEHIGGIPDLWREWGNLWHKPKYLMV